MILEAYRPSIAERLYPPFMRLARTDCRGRQDPGRAIERLQVPGDLVGAVMFLSSAARDFMTSQIINVTAVRRCIEWHHGWAAAGIAANDAKCHKRTHAVQQTTFAGHTL
jgi:hypothetical protein